MNSQSSVFLCQCLQKAIVNLAEDKVCLSQLFGVPRLSIKSQQWFCFLSSYRDLGRKALFSVREHSRYLSFSSIGMIKYNDLKQIGEERVYKLVVYNPLLREVRKEFQVGTWRQELKQRPWSRNAYLPACSLWLVQPTFLYYPGLALILVVWTFLY